MHVLRFKFRKVPWWFWNGTAGLVCTAHLKQGQQGCSFSAATWWLTQGGVNGNCSRPTKRQTASKDRSHRGALIEVCCRAVDTVLFGRATHCIFLWLCIIWNPLPLTALGSARHLELTHAITLSPFSCCITVYQCPFFSASISLLTFCHQAHRRKNAKQKRKTKTLKTKPTNTGA